MRLQCLDVAEVCPMSNHCCTETPFHPGISQVSHFVLRTNDPAFKIVLHTALLYDIDTAPLLHTWVSRSCFLGM